jgi:hypothetical protein
MKDERKDQERNPEIENLNDKVVNPEELRDEALEQASGGEDPDGCSGTLICGQYSES